LAAQRTERAFVEMTSEDRCPHIRTKLNSFLCSFATLETEGIVYVCGKCPNGECRGARIAYMSQGNLTSEHM
jgi:hypothetical protein